MSLISGIPQGAQIAISDLLDSCAKIQPGQEVVLLAQIDGLYGGDNLVDREAMDWIASAIRYRGANASILWIDEPAKPHAWRFPRVVKAALSACDVFINNSFDMEWEDIYEYSKFGKESGKTIIRNFATTAPLLCTAWAQTPYELLSEIRYQASISFNKPSPWQLTDENGTHLEGTFISPEDPTRPGQTTYSRRRREMPFLHLPWPEWKHTPFKILNVNGEFIFDRMLGWWSRYIGISPYFNKPIKLTIENSFITAINGGDEADALRTFLNFLRDKQGNDVFKVPALHSGIHPQASVGPQQCPHPLIRRMIEHSHSCNLHIHIGKPAVTREYPYVFHCTADIRKPTFKVGNQIVHERGHLVALDHPAVLEIAKKYPNRPTLNPVPISC